LKKITFDRNVINDDIDRLKKLGYTDDQIEIFVGVEQARARVRDQQPSFFDRLLRLFRGGPR